MMQSRPEAAGNGGAERERKAPARVHTLARLGLLAAAAVAAYVFEAMLPAPLPWARLGLSNIVVVLVLFGQGLGAAFAVNLVRIVAGNLLTGMLLGPAFVFSAAGSTAALLVMAGLRRSLVPPLSIAGASLAGAVTNNVVQVAVFGALFAPSGATRHLLGLMVLAGVAVGLVTGLAAAAMVDKVGLASRGAPG
jgi:heptaprenyl diphosphate synthase